MGKASAHRLSETCVALGRALRPVERASLERALRRLLAWQRTLRGFPPLARAPDATPYVSLYVRGRLRGCWGSHEGPPEERLERAFLLALADGRYGSIAPDERRDLAADVAYVTRARPVRADEAAMAMEPGVHGVAVVHEGVATVLLPSVAREHGHDANRVLDVLAKKAGRARSDEGLVWLLDVEEVSSRGARASSPTVAAKRWLESLVAKSGEVAFEMTPTGDLVASGTMRHGRAAVAVEALGALGSASARRARAWLARSIAHGLEGHELGWPDRPDMILGTLALAARAGVQVPLESFAASIDVAACSPWHAAQAAAVLGARTTPQLWDACVRSLETRPFSPYALIAARARGDGEISSRTTRAIVDAIRGEPPFLGGAAITPVPETALTSVAIEALAPLATAEARRAVRAARAFVLARQLLDIGASMHPRCLGAFSASPIASALRCDVTAHAVLACGLSRHYT
ncbi:MAG TPA: AMMECR1 domain-containing protein [Polyangiaceae bacterium]|jgi:hypothetical protein